MKFQYANTKLNIAEECLARHANSKIASNVAMVFVAADMSSQKFTYAQLNDLSARFAASLVEHGLVAGDRVLLRLPNTHIFPVAFFGCLRAGVIPVPTSTMLTAIELQYLIENSCATALVTDERLFSKINTLDCKSLRAIYISGECDSNEQISVEVELERLSPMNAIHQSNGGDPAYLVYTSGTTGYPKGVLHAHQSLMGRKPAATNWFNFTADSTDVILHSGKFNWTYVLGTAMMDPLYHGKTVVVYEGENSAERWLELIRHFECTTFIGVPTIFRQILQKTNATASNVPTLQHTMCAGEHLSDEVLHRWTERFGLPIYEGLGMSECSYYISQRPQDKMKPNSAGKIQPGHLAEVLDENFMPVPADTEGMLCIHRNDPGLFLEYWQADEANTKLFQNGWFLTGDFATVDAEGYVYFLGRRDEIIKSFGYRVSPLEIERVFRDHPHIEDVVAFAEILGPEITLISLCVKLKPDFEYDGESILSWGKERLAGYKLPKKIYQLDKLPRSTNGKVLRNQITKALGIS